MTARRRPARPNNATNFPSSKEPSTISTSSSPPGFPRHLEADAELVGPEVGDGANGVGLRRGPARTLARRGHARFGRHLPVLDADQLFAAVVVPQPTGHVTRSHDAVGGEEPVIADDAVLERQPRVLAANSTAGTTPMPTTTTSASRTSPPSSLDDQSARR